MLGNFLDLSRRMVFSHRRAWLQMLSAWLHLDSSPYPRARLM